MYIQKIRKKFKKNRSTNPGNPAQKIFLKKNFIFLIFLLAYIHGKLLQIVMTYIREGIISYFPQYLSHTQTKEKEMKFYKYAGVGMTAWGLMLGGAYADSTIIASKAYVDSKVSGIDVSGAVATGTNALEIADSTTTAPSVTAVKGMRKTGTAANTTDLTTRNSSNVITSTGSDTAVPTTALLVDVLQTIDGQNADGATGVSAGATADANKAGMAVIAVEQTDGRVKATLGTIGTYGLAANAVTAAKIAAKNVQYAKHMNNESLFDINTGIADSTSGACVKDNPCMLTYYKEGGKVYTRWTPLETDSLSANVSVTSDGV